MRPPYVPDSGDLVWLSFNPQAGREQAGHRPGLVLSPKAYNQTSGLVVVCPITSKNKGYPFEVVLPAGLKISGAVLSDHLKSLDWRARKISFKDKAPQGVMDEVSAKVAALLNL